MSRSFHEGRATDVLPSAPRMSLGRRGLLAAALAEVVSRAGAETPSPRPPDPARPGGRVDAVRLVEGEMATAMNLLTGATYGPTESGPRRNIQHAIVEARDGDTIQISPGAIWAPGRGDGSGFLEAGMLHVWKSLTITSFRGKGRWRLAPPSVDHADGWSGIVIREPINTYSDAGDTVRLNPRKTIVIEGFDFDNWGRKSADFGVRIRSGSKGGSWDNVHASVTLRGFKLGKRRYDESASGINGSAENLLIESGHVFDTGGSIGSGPGLDHNFYLGGKNVTMRGVRGNRTRGLAGGPMDGHIVKVAAVNTVIEGCAFDCGPSGDNSYNIQCRAGGNVVIRGCLIVGGAGTGNRGTGVIGYENEITQTPWYYGAEGHSVLIEKNVIISHFDKPLVFFRAPGHAWQVQGVSSVVIRDNIGMCAATKSWMPRFKEPEWIRDDPTKGPGWSVHNSRLPYGPDEPGFDGRAQLLYKRSGGPIRGSGTVSTYRFVFPQGHVPRIDDHQGLG